MLIGFVRNTHTVLMKLELAKQPTSLNFSDMLKTQYTHFRRALHT